MTDQKRPSSRDGAAGLKGESGQKAAESPASSLKDTAHVELPNRSDLVVGTSASARHKETDSLLESLHRSLIAQVASNPLEGRKAIQEGVLSGATVTRIVPGRTHIRDRAVKEFRGRKNEARTKLALSASKNEEIVSLAQSLGIDVSRAAREMLYARAALGKGEVAKARRWSANADRHACEAVSQRLPLLVKRTHASLKQLEGMSGSTGLVKQLLDESKEALKRGEHAEALMSLIDARERMHRVENGAMLNIIADAKTEFVKAKKVGLNIDEAVSLLNKSRDNLQRGNFPEAVKFAKESRALVEKSLEKHRDIQYPVQECVKVIRLAEALGADVQDLEGKLAVAKQLYRHSQLEQSATHFHELLDLARKTAYGKAAESYELAEKSLTLAKKTVGDVPEAEEKLRVARELLEKDELAKSVSMACASMFESDSAIANALSDRLKSIDEFSKGIERDVDSLTEVREAIDSSKARNLENLRRFASLTEEIVGEAYECAAAYSRVAQDIVKQAYESSVEVSDTKDMVDRSADGITLPAEISTVRQPSDEKRQRLIDMFLTGRVSEDQLDKLLLVVDSSVEKKELV